MFHDRVTHPTPLTLVQNIAVMVVVGIAVYLSGSPLPLFCLLLLQPLPILQMDGQPVMVRGDELDDDRNREPEIGFTAKLRDTCMTSEAS